MKSTLNGLHIWLVNVVPALFPFFILTKIIICLNQSPIRILDKFTDKFFNIKAGLIYALSILSGYPVGAKMISSYYELGKIDKSTASNMMSFCSTSGPMFIVGSVGIGIFKSAKIGYILLISHIIGSFINGLIFTRFPAKKSRSNSLTPQVLMITNKNTKNDVKISNTSLNDIMYDSIISILMVGGYIVFACVIIFILNITIFPAISMFLAKILHINASAISSVLSGILEITNGILSLSLCPISLKIKVIISSGLIAFSGICIMLQSVGFLDKIGIKKGLIVRQKLTQALVTTIITTIIVFIFL